MIASCKRYFAVILVAAALAASPAIAQKRDTANDGLATSEAAAANVVKPDQGEEAPPSLEDSESDQFVAEKEAELSKVRQRQIEQMRSILRKNPLYKKKADLLFRIAEKEWEEAKYRYFLERKKYENGLSTSFQILQVQEDLTSARYRLVAAATSYRRAQVDYQRAIGQLLGRAGIRVTD